MSLLGIVVAKALRWLWEEAKEKLDVRGTWAKIRASGKKYGRRFLVAAVAWELFEDVALPLLAIWLGYPQVAPVFLVIHFEPVVYPVFLYAFRSYDRIRGREPWEPDRATYSSSMRSWCKVASHRLVTVGLFWLFLGAHGWPLWVLVAYSLLMTGFKYVHERMWHDSGYGITPDGLDVMPRRVVLKSLTYRAVSALVMCGVLRAFLGRVPWGPLLAYQQLAWAACVALEFTWARSAWGIRANPRRI